jgi:hypothetical protein
MSESPQIKYYNVMKVIRGRFDVINQYLDRDDRDFFLGEILAFHTRKIIEAIAFGCMIALENSKNSIPTKLKKEYSADKILKHLRGKNSLPYPSPSEIRKSTPAEFFQYKSKITCAGIEEYRLTIDELLSMYGRTHKWLHEFNPYSKNKHQDFALANIDNLINDIKELNNFISSHAISLDGIAFMCKLVDKVDGQTKVVPISKVSDL